jgi:hypothetical protein
MALDGRQTVAFATQSNANPRTDCNIAIDDGCVCGLELKHVLWAVEIAAWQKQPRAKKAAGIFGRALFPLAFVLFCS